MKRLLYTFLFLMLTTIGSSAQNETVQNRPYTDLKPFHFGVLIGTHLQDMELMNVGPQVITNEDGSTSTTVITADQDRWDPGLTVGVLAELRLNTYLQFRVAPTMYFGAHHITFHNLTQIDADGNPTEQRQDMKTAYIAMPLELIFAAPRVNNHRPYIMAGINPMINLSGKQNDYLKLNTYGAFLELGIGCDFYLPYFKLRPELKFMYGLGNSLDTKHSARLQDPTMVPYSNSVDKAHTKIIALTFYFE